MSRTRTRSARRTPKHSKPLALKTFRAPSFVVSSVCERRLEGARQAGHAGHRRDPSTANHRRRGPLRRYWARRRPTPERLRTLSFARRNLPGPVRTRRGHVDHSPRRPSAGSPPMKRLAACASPRHNALGAAMTIELGVALRGGPCRVLSADQRIVAQHGEHYVYADASVVYGSAELQPGTTDVLSNPSVVVGVLSRRTEAYDRGQKWEWYRRIVAVTDYLLVSQTAPRIEHYRREANGGRRSRCAGCALQWRHDRRGLRLCRRFRAGRRVTRISDEVDSKRKGPVRNARRSFASAPAVTLARRRGR
jgi:hypothetical protein